VFSVLGHPLPQATVPQHLHVLSPLQSGGQSTHAVICVCGYIYCISNTAVHTFTYKRHTDIKSRLMFTFYTSLVVLTMAPAWRSFLTTLEWPLKDAIISAVAPPLPCEEVWREGCFITVHGDNLSHTQTMLSLVL